MERERKKPSSPETTNDGVIKLIVYGCVVIGIAVKLLTDGGVNPVPNLIIFKELPTTTFHAFIISIMFAFAGAFSSLLIRSSSSRIQFSYYEKCCRCYSLVFAAMAMAILVIAVIRTVFQQMQIPNYGSIKSM
ncbi:uncharacterized protein LOC112536584 [Ricinus communis]|uniref:uncharacterized protein LOC112536584 n=1 Tax=Ricinus communis TaxID=3988 RepID=UPI00201A46E8|nr:uncharacterized protein LOC112536584 [Ricinus communis]